MDDIVSLANKLSGAGLFTLSCIIFYAGWKRMWVWGYQLEEMRKDRDDWKNMALQGTRFAERAVSLVVKQP